MGGNLHLKGFETAAHKKGFHEIKFYLAPARSKCFN